MLTLFYHNFTGKKTIDQLDTLKLAILKRLYFSHPQSIAELSSSIGKSVPNITSAINQLQDAGFIKNGGLAPSTGGRRAAQFIPNTQQLRMVLSIAIDQFYTSIAIVDFNNNYRTPIRTEAIDLQASDAYLKLVQLIESTLSESDPSLIFGIGITIPGFVDSQTGKNHSYPSDSEFYNLTIHIERKFNLPTFVENDSSAIAIAEHRFGQAQEAKDVMVVNLNWGVGLGMIMDNMLYRGHSGYAGEFSHIPLSNLNKLCSCGKKGCLEVEASLVAAVEFASQRLASGEESSLRAIFVRDQIISGDQLLDAAIQGDQLAIEALKRIGHMLGKGIATLIHIVNPQLVVISGRGAKAKNILLPQIQSAVLEFSIHRLSKHTKIAFSETPSIQLLGSTCICILQADKKIYNTKLTKV